MTSRLAMITFLDDGGLRPDNSLPGQPPYPSQGPGFPTHPIAPGGPPPGIWPSPPGGVVSPPIYYPPYPSTGPGFPTHPIAPGGQPPGAAQLPVFPPVGPDNTLPPVPGAPPPQVSLPIYFPPHVSPMPPREDQKFELKWSPMYGWVLVPVQDDEAEPK